MAIVLQVLGAAFLTLILLVIVAVLLIRFKLKTFLRSMEQMVSAAGANATTPPRISLERLASPDWSDSDAVEELTDPLPELGFEPAGTYDVPEVPGLVLEGWVDPKRSVIAVVYEHPQAGVWLDLVTRYRDGTRATFINSAAGAGAEHQPGNLVERLPGLGTKELLDRLLAARPDAPMEPATAEDFAAVFTKAYADEMDWRMSRGGTTLEEVRAIAVASGLPSNPELDEATRAAVEQQAMENLDDVLRTNFLNESGISAARWEAVKDRVVVIHDRMPPDYREQILCDWIDTDDLPPVTGSWRSVFASFNKRLPPGENFEALGTVSSPIEADVYVAPDGDRD